MGCCYFSIELCQGNTAAATVADTHERTRVQSRQTQSETPRQAEFKGDRRIEQFVSIAVKVHTNLETLGYIQI